MVPAANKHFPHDFQKMTNEFSTLVVAAAKGNSLAARQLLPLVYEELRKLAARKMAKERPGQTLSATDLVHEAFLRLIKSDDVSAWDTQEHFYAAAAEAMRRILIEAARRKGRVRHGGLVKRIRIESDLIADPDDESWADELLELDLAIDELGKQYPETAELVKLRYFAGLKMSDAAKTLGISRRTGQRHWAFAKAWLYKKLNPGN